MQHDQYGGPDNDYPLAIGKVIGARGWTFSDDGRLLSPMFGAFPWVPGVNETAPCTAGSDDGGAPAHAVLNRRQGEPDVRNPAKAGVLDPKCACGFYGTTRLPGGDLYGDVMGLVEGFGVTLIGTVGFRASKARIVALARGVIAADDPGSRWERMKGVLREVWVDVPIFDDFNRMLLDNGWRVDDDRKQIVSPEPGA